MSTYDEISDLHEEADRLGVKVHWPSDQIFPGHIVDVVKRRPELLADIARAKVDLEINELRARRVELIKDLSMINERLDLLLPQQRGIT